MTTFEWLFQTWLEAMHYKHPISIITDQDPSMKVAIPKVFPNTVHRCCQWHVMWKAREHLGVLYDQKAGFKIDLMSCVNQSLTVEEFEENWTNMVKKHDLENNRHLKLMFSTRNHWVLAYFWDIFFADMSTSQRSESINSNLKMWVNANTPMYKFVIQFEKMRDGIFDRESEEDLKTKNKIASLWSKDDIEKDARRVYTRNVFKRFKLNLQEGSSYSVGVLQSGVLYELKSMKFQVSYKVKIDKTNLKISCDCKGFEHEGLLCPHSLQVMRSIGMHTLPHHYILKRWTKDANASAKLPFSDEEGEIEGCNTLASKLKRLILEAHKSDDAYMDACLMVDEIVDKLILRNCSNNHLVTEKENTTSEWMVLSNNNVSLRDPPVSQCKGKLKPHRIKPSSEKKMRKCSSCGKKAGHNARTCKRDVSEGGKRKAQVNPELEKDDESEGDYEFGGDYDSNGDYDSEPDI